MAARRFPPPWTVEELEACYVVRDHGGQALAYIYFEEEPGRQSATKLLTKDEAGRRMKLVTTYLVVHKGQIPCKRYCKRGHQTPYSRHQQRRGRCYKLPNERW
jgi:hypothetical protein